MAKENFLLHGSKGSVGNITVRKSKGQTVISERVTTVTNPRSSGQVLHRAKFANLSHGSKFYNDKTLALAFQDKKSKQSYANQWMKANISNALPFTKEMSEDVYMPVLGSLVMAKGNLPRVDAEYQSSGTYYGNFIVNIPDLTTSSTVGDLSKALISKYKVQEGDIFTVMQYSTDLTAVSNGQAIYFSDSPVAPALSVNQIIINTSSRAELPELLEGSINGLVVDGGESMCAIGVVCMFSRKMRTGYAVSNASMSWNETAQNAIAVMKSAAHQSLVLTSWGASSEDVLAGSVALGNGPIILTCRGAVDDESKFDTVKASVVGLRLNGLFTSRSSTAAQNCIKLTGLNLSQLDDGLLTINCSGGSDKLDTYSVVEYEEGLYDIVIFLYSGCGIVSIYYDGELICYGEEAGMTNYTLTVDASPANGGTVTGGGTYASGSSASISAVANSGYNFLRWSDGNTQAARDVVMTSDLSLTAIFSAS